jgi:hypothetical protein
MLIRFAVALALALGTAQAAESIRPARGETTASFQCRAAYIPEARQCVQQCDASASGDARWECVHACTTRSLWSMAQCREGGAPVAASVATR